MQTDPLSATFSALADPTRRAILARLALGETTVSDLAEPFDMSLPAVSKHLKVLERAGLIARGREAQWRPCRIEVNALRTSNNSGEATLRKHSSEAGALTIMLPAFAEPSSQLNKVKVAVPPGTLKP